MKAITYGYDPSSAENDDAAKWWMAIGRRFLLLWEHTTDEPALLQEALTAFSNAQRTISDDAIDPEVLCDEVHVQFALGLYCHVIKKCQHVAFELWGNLDRMTQVWLWEGQAHFHVGDYHEAALRFQSIMTRSVPSTPLMPYTNVELWVILGRCAVLCNNLDRAQLYYDKILCSMYGDDDIVRRGLSWEHVMNDATLHLTCGSKCAKRRDFPLAVDLLRYGKQLNPNVTTVHHDEVLAECIRHTVHLDTRASRATWEAQKRIPLTRLRERLGVVL
ncbi:hypothetical protein DYB32_000935 [Aphanomyces invadans]|nr:hypothetical protein DYB32_000935 [Aphanomyces invadans]